MLVCGTISSIVGLVGSVVNLVWFPVKSKALNPSIFQRGTEVPFNIMSHMVLLLFTGIALIFIAVLIKKCRDGKLL